jgi:hypothetical protein
VKLAAGFIGILVIMLGWAYLAIQSAGPKSAFFTYVYVPAVVSCVVGSALYWFWSRKSD